MGWKVEDLGGGKYRASNYPANPWNEEYTKYTVRELIKLARTYSHDSKQNTAIKRNLKKESKCERAFVRDELRKKGEEADAVHPKKKFSDRWNWD